MRILFVTNMWPDPEHPSSGSFVYSQAASLRSAGNQVDVLQIRGHASRWEYLRAAREMVKHTFDTSHDVVHAHYGHSAVVAALELRRPLVVSYCGDDLLGTPSPERPSEMTRASRVLARGFAQVSRIAKATITKSEQMAMELPRSVRARNHVIPNGVDLEMFRRIDQDTARRELGWETGEKIVLFVGDPAIPRKNFELAARACELAAGRCPALRLRLATSVAPERMPVWMSAADVLIHPSWSEGSPNVVKEAMACELPIVATAAGDTRERLRDVPGCHVLAPDDHLFADALLDALTRGPCPAARAAVADLSLERVAQRVVRIYESVIGS